MRRTALLGISLFVFVLAATVAACGGTNAGDGGGGATLEATADALSAETPVATKPPTVFRTSSAAVARLIIPSIGVDRATVEGVVNTRTQEMVAPRGDALGQIAQLAVDTGADEPGFAQIEELLRSVW